MDKQMSKWITEFLIRQRVDDNILDRLIARLPLEDADYRLKKGLLLRRIQTEVSKGMVSEKILDMLELVGELDFYEGKCPSEAMRASYCSVALDCTVRFLEFEDDRMYFETLQRIWNGRVQKMGKSGNSGLISEKLLSCRDDLEAARFDVELRDKILSRNTRYEALKAVKGYLAESWSEMGPSFLEKTAFEDVAEAENRGNVLDNEQGLEDLENVAGALNGITSTDRPPAETQGVEGLENVTEAGKGDNVDEKEQSLEGLENVVEAHNGITPIPNDRPSAETQHKQGSSRRKHVGVRRKILYGRGSIAKIFDHEEVDKDTSKNAYHCFPTPELNQTRADLMSSFADLNAAVRDPLPEALKIAEGVSSDVQRDTGVGRNHGTEMNVDGVRDPLPEGLKIAEGVSSDVQRDTGVGRNHGTEINVDSTPTDKRNRLGANSVEYIRGDGLAQREEHGNENQSITSDPLEFTEEASPSRPRLQSPKRRRLIPLNTYRTTKLERRRQPRKWSVLEEDTLRKGVQEFGRGNWKVILREHRDIFEERTEVDLKDKWRNLTRFSR